MFCQDPPNSCGLLPGYSTNTHMLGGGKVPKPERDTRRWVVGSKKEVRSHKCRDGFIIGV